MKLLHLFFMGIFGSSCLAKPGEPPLESWPDTNILALIQIMFAQPLFFDDFESGALDHSDNGVSYLGGVRTNVSDERAFSGSFSLQFRFQPAPPGSDSFSEQRVNLPVLEEMWIAYDLYIPLNFTHRNDSGPDNNKFLAVYRDPYTNPGFQINWSTNPNGAEGSNLSLHRYRNGSEQSSMAPTGGLGEDFLTVADREQWVRIVAHIKVPSDEFTSDGVMQMWKDGVMVTDEQNLDNYGGDMQNYFDELYLLGWSNSGYLEETIFFIDNLTISQTYLE